jgi:hypothetical protein
MVKSRSYEALHYAFFSCFLSFYLPSSPVIRHDKSVPLDERKTKFHTRKAQKVYILWYVVYATFCAVDFYGHLMKRLVHSSWSSWQQMALYVTVVSLQATKSQLNINSLELKVFLSNI